MGLFDLFTRKNDSFYANDEYENENGEFVDEPVAHTQTTSPSSTFIPSKPSYSTTAQQPTKMQVIVIEPKSFEAANKVAEAVRQMRPVVINFENTDSHTASRIVDFVSGAIFALDGKMEKIGKDIFIVVPSNVSIDYSDKTYADISDNYATSWKETRI